MQYRIGRDNRATIVPDCFLPIVYPMAWHFQRTAFKLIWTQFCVTDNDFCNSLLFSIKLFRSCLHSNLTFVFFSYENGTLKLSHRYHIGRLFWPTVSTIGLLHNRRNLINTGTLCAGCSKKSDIVFVVDNSGSIRDNNPTNGSWDNWQLIREFVITAVRGFNISYDRTRVPCIFSPLRIATA